MTARERVLVAFDTPEAEVALRLAAALRGQVGGFKVGLELFASRGPAIVAKIRDSGLPIFLDLKLHDIPNTVAGAAAAAARLGVAWLTVHALGGPEMIRRAAEASAAAAVGVGLPAPTILAVTLLTSQSAADLEGLGIEGPPERAVLRLARLALEAGAGGIVCSALEVASVREIFPQGELVVPGIRPAGASPDCDDQVRVATPAGAIARGADRVVVGRPITRAQDPVAAAEAIVREIEAG